MTLTTLWHDEMQDLEWHYEYDLANWEDAYTRGYRPAHYPVPSTNVYSAEDYFAAYYALELCKEFFSEGL